MTCYNMNVVSRCSEIRSLLSIYSYSIFFSQIKIVIYLKISSKIGVKKKDLSHSYNHLDLLNLSGKLAKCILENWI